MPFKFLLSNRVLGLLVELLVLTSFNRPSILTARTNGRAVAPFRPGRRMQLRLVVVLGERPVRWGLLPSKQRG